MSDFDPDAYLATKGGGDFSPDAYLASKEPSHASNPQVLQATQKAEPQKAKAPAVGYWAQRKAELPGIGRNLADLGDMTLSMPGGLAANVVSMGGQLKDQVLESFKAQGKTHKQIGEEALKENNELTERWSTNVFARALNSVLDDGQEAKPSDIQKAMTSVGSLLEKGGKLVEKKTGQRVTAEEFNLEAQFFMNLAGTKGLVKAGGKLWTKATAPRETAAPPEPPPAETKPSVDFKTFSEFVKEQRETDAKTGKPAPTAEEAPAKRKVDYKEYQKHLQETADKHVEEGAKAREEASTKPGDPIYEATEKLKTTLAKQAGGISPEQAWNIAAISLGAGLGAKYLDPDNPIVGAFHGMLYGAAATAPGLKTGYAVGKAAVQTIRGTGKPPVDEVRATPLVRARDAAIAAGGLASFRTQVKVWGFVPELTDRQALTHAIDQGKTGTLKGDMAKAAQVIHQSMVDIGNRALKAGVLKGLVDNYISHVVAPKDVAKAQALFNSRTMGGGSTTSRFAQTRKIPTIAQLKAAGIEVTTEDAAEIVGIYARSMEHAVANKNLATNLQMTKLPNGQGLMAYPEGKAPPGYVDAGISGVKVHPDLKASIGFMFEAKDVNGIAASGLAFNTAIKRMEVMNPLFHYRSLLESRIGSTFRWDKAVKEVGQFLSPRLFGQHDILQQIKFGPAGDRVEALLKEGLQVTFENSAEPLDSDVRGGFYKAMSSWQSSLDKHFGPVGKVGGAAIRAFARINHKVDNMLWGRGQAGWKVVTALEESEKLLRNAGKRGIFMTQQMADRTAVRMSNMRYGSLDWHMIAEETNNKLLRNFALNAFTEKGRAAMGVLAFAPDWKASTLGAFIAQFEKGSGPRGLWQPTTLADLARQQQLRTAVYYATIVNGINYALSGHFIWENGKDGKGPNWMWIDRGDGTKMSGSKHALEAFHAMENPGTFAISSLGIIPSEILDQLGGTSGREYTYVGRDRQGNLGLQGPPMKDGRLNHALKRLAPIGTPDLSQGVGPAAWGLAGYNVYGKTEEQKRAARKEKRERAFQERLKKLKEQ